MAINFPIVTTFDERAVKKADKAFTALGKTFIGVFSVAKVVQFSKASVRAFAESQKEAQLLATQLESINLGFASPYLNEFIDKLALATGKTGGELTNAFIALSQATGDATTAQKILSTALDVSLGTGKDLQTVSVALQRAYKGETTALAKLRIGYSTAELKGKDFNDVLADLQNRFEGAAAAAADTFAGKLARLTEAVEQAKEAFGKGFVEGLQSSQIEVEELQRDIINLGTVLGKTAAASVAFADKMIQQLDRVGKSQAANFVLSLFEKLTNYVVGPIVFGQVGTSFSSADAARQAAANRAAEKSASARLRALNALSRAEGKTAAIKLQNEKKVTAEKKKQNTESKIIDEINKRFELDRIQIQAALGGQINDVERLRLELMQAILDEDVKRAIILEGQLIKAEAAAAELALILDSLDEMVGDPFADWPGTIERIQELLKQLKIKIPIETLFAEKGLRLDQNTMTVTKLDRMNVNANNVYVTGFLQGGGGGGGGGGGTSQLSADIFTLFNAGDPVAIDAVQQHAFANAALADANLLLADALLDESMLGLPSGDTNITVIVEGNVTSAEDLAEVITDIQYTYQKTGKGLLLQSRAI
jgi:hypothetical protein